MGLLIHRGFALALILAVIVLTAISIYSFASNLGQGAPNQESTLMKVLNGNKLSPDEQKTFGEAQSRASLVFSADKVDLVEKTVSGTLQFNLPPGVQDEVVDTNHNNAKVFSCDSSGACNLKPQYANRKVDVYIIGASSEGASQFDFDKTFPMSDIDKSVLGQVNIPVTFPLTGFPNNYPNDYYFFDVQMAFYLPDGIERLVNGQTPTGYQKDYYGVETTGLQSQNLSAKISPLVDAKGKPVDGNFHLSFTRATQQAVYIYAVALIPLIFGLLFAHLLFLSWHFEDKTFEEFTEALIVAVLAVMPLRLVLVPIELEGVTRVDLVLAIGLILIVSVAVIKYAAEISGFAGEKTLVEKEEEQAAAMHAAPAPAEA